MERAALLPLLRHIEIKHLIRSNSGIHEDAYLMVWDLKGTHAVLDRRAAALCQSEGTFQKVDTAFDLG